MKKLLLTLVFSSALYAQSPVTTLQDITVLDNNSDGYTQFDLTSNKTVLLNGLDAKKHTITYHLNFQDADLNRNAISKPKSYTNTTAESQELYARISSKTDSSNYSVDLFNIIAISPAKQKEAAALAKEKNRSR